MNFAVGLGCLVTVAAIAASTGLPEQQLRIENQIADHDDDHLERQDIDRNTKRDCKIAGGMCQPLTEECDGEFRDDRFYCRNPRNFGCCIPPGCVFKGKAYPNNANFEIGCIKYHCNKGVPEPSLDFCETISVNSGTPCICRSVKGKGCILGENTLPNLACRCINQGTQTDPECTGTVVQCSRPMEKSCISPGRDYEHCMQGVHNNQGNCCGYDNADPNTCK